MPTIIGIWLAAVAVLSSLHTVTASLWPQTDWIVPLAPDNHTTFVNGNTYVLRWSSDLPVAYNYYIKSGSPTDASLYLTNDENTFTYVIDGKWCSDINVSLCKSATGNRY